MAGETRASITSNGTAKEKFYHPILLSNDFESRQRPNKESNVSKVSCGCGPEDDSGTLIHEGDCTPDHHLLSKFQISQPRDSHCINNDNLRPTAFFDKSRSSTVKLRNLSFYSKKLNPKIHLLRQSRNNGDIANLSLVGSSFNFNSTTKTTAHKE